MENENQAMEDILAGYHGTFARQRMDIGMNSGQRETQPNRRESIFIVKIDPYHST